MRKGLLVVAGGLVSALLFSGCFAMRSLEFTDDKVEAGKKTIAKISVVGDTEGDMLRGGSGGDEFPFFFFVSEGGSLLANGGEFDTKGIFDGPVDLKKNADLAIAASDSCQGSVPFRAKRGVPAAGNAVTTDAPFDASSQLKFMDAKLPIKVSEVGQGDAFGIFMGTWFDDGDGVPEDEGSSDDGYECQPPYTSGVKIKGGAPPPP